MRGIVDELSITSRSPRIHNGKRVTGKFEVESRMSRIERQILRCQKVYRTSETAHAETWCCPRVDKYFARMLRSRQWRARTAGQERVMLRVL